MVAGPSRVGLAFLLLHAALAVPLVDGYALSGLPPARRAAWVPKQLGAIELGLSCGAAVEREFGMLLSCDPSLYLFFVRGGAPLSF